jgi:hypothetical protein
VLCCALRAEGGNRPSNIEVAAQATTPKPHKEIANVKLERRGKQKKTRR